MNNHIEQLSQLEGKIILLIKEAKSEKELDAIKLEYLGKKGPLKTIKEHVPTITDAEEKKMVGTALNATLTRLASQFEETQKHLRHQKIETLKQKEWVDVTLPGVKKETGHLHPITQIRQEAEDIFMRMGFEIIEPQTLDTDYYVFETLNIPKGHPARDLWDTFWTEDGLIPITHTSAMQHRIIKEKTTPIRAIVPGRCFRQEATDATHEHTFYQIEGVYVDKGITLADLIGTLKTFLSTFYKRSVKLRIQPSYFPFVEPGLEIMIDCAICKDKEGYCSTCRGKRWIELVPAGPIHPNVLKMAGSDPEIFSGFAWGLGLDRLAMIRYGIEDLRWFHSGDLRFLKQF